MLIRVSWPQITQSQLTIDLSALSATLDHRVIFSVNCCWALLPATSLANACPLKLFSVVMHRWLICVRISATQACLCPVLVPPWTSIKYLVLHLMQHFFSLWLQNVSVCLWYPTYEPPSTPLGSTYSTGSLMWQMEIQCTWCYVCQSDVTNRNSVHMVLHMSVNQSSNIYMAQIQTKF